MNKSTKPLTPKRELQAFAKKFDRLVKAFPNINVCGDRDGNIISYVISCSPYTPASERYLKLTHN